MTQTFSKIVLLCFLFSGLVYSSCKKKDNASPDDTTTTTTSNVGKKPSMRIYATILNQSHHPSGVAISLYKSQADYNSSANAVKSINTGSDTAYTFTDLDSTVQYYFSVSAGGMNNSTTTYSLNPLAANLYLSLDWRKTPTGTPDTPRKMSIVIK